MVDVGDADLPEARLACRPLPVASIPAMTPPLPNRPSPNRAGQSLDPELRDRLKAELKAPYRGLRQFIYVAFGASGLIGAVIFFFQVLAGRDVDAALPNLALQVSVVALMVWLFRWEQRSKRSR